MKKEVNCKIISIADLTVRIRASFSTYANLVETAVDLFFGRSTLNAHRTPTRPKPSILLIIVAGEDAVFLDFLVVVEKVIVMIDDLLTVCDHSDALCCY